MIQVIISNFLTDITNSALLSSFMERPFHICGVCSDAETLLSASKFYKPDLILLDMQLEGLQNLDILYQLREQNPITEIIALSDKRSFAEIYTAMQCSIYEFLCKPVTLKDLSSSLNRSKNRIKRNRGLDAVFESKQFIGKLFMQYAKKVSPEKQMGEDTINDLYRTLFIPDAYRIVTIGFEISDDSPVTDQQYVTKKCAERFFFCLEKKCHELLFDIDYLRIHALLNYNLSDDAKIKKSLIDCQKEVAAMLPTGMLCTFCCSETHSKISDIQEMLDEAVNAMWSRFYCGKNKVLYTDTDKPYSLRIQNIYEETERRLKTACTILDLELFQQTLFEFFSRPDYIVGRHETRALLRRIEYYMLDINQNLISAFTDFDRAGLDIKLSLRTANTLKDYKNQFANQLISLFNQILVHHGQQSQPIRKAQHYIQENYASTVTLSAAAKYVGLTPVYLSARFKEELGIGFSDYLNRYRIDISKQLLAETDEKIVTIAQMTGYTNPRYYSQIFKKLEGIRPTDYRISKQHNQEQGNNSGVPSCTNGRA